MSTTWKDFQLVGNMSNSERERQEQIQSGQTVLANLKTDQHLIGWAIENGLYQRIDRRSIWGNPFRICGDGGRDRVCEKYRLYLEQKPSLLARVENLRGKVLACWCYPKRCHGNELINILNERSERGEGAV